MCSHGKKEIIMRKRLMAAVLFFTSCAMADTYLYWDTSDDAGLQSTAGVWSNSVVNWNASNTGADARVGYSYVANQRAIFGAGTYSVDAQDVTVGKIQAQSSAIVDIDGLVTVENGGTSQFLVNNGATLTLNAAVAGDDLIQLAGLTAIGGTLVLNATNTFSNVMNVVKDGSTIVVKNPDALGTTGSDASRTQLGAQSAIELDASNGTGFSLAENFWVTGDDSGTVGNTVSFENTDGDNTLSGIVNLRPLTSGTGTHTINLDVSDGTSLTLAGSGIRIANSNISGDAVKTGSGELVVSAVNTLNEGSFTIREGLVTKMAGSDFGATNIILGDISGISTVDAVLALDGVSTDSAGVTLTVADNANATATAELANSTGHLWFQYEQTVLNGDLQIVNNSPSYFFVMTSAMSGPGGVTISNNSSAQVQYQGDALNSTYSGTTVIAKGLVIDNVGTATETSGVFGAGTVQLGVSGSADNAILQVKSLYNDIVVTSGAGRRAINAAGGNLNGDITLNKHAEFNAYGGNILNIWGEVSGDHTVIFNGTDANGTVQLAGSSRMNVAEMEIRDQVVSLFGNDVIDGNSMQLDMWGGEFKTLGSDADFAELILTGDAEFDFENVKGTDGTQWTFADSSAQSWNAAAVLIITNFNVAEDRIYFGVNGLTAAQQAQIKFATEDGLVDSVFTAGGYLYSSDDPVPSPGAILSFTQVSDSVMELVVNSDNPSWCYPKSALALTADTVWSRVGHSTNGAAPFVETNLNYSAVSGTNLVIYVEVDEDQKFFAIGEE
jgi:hypothetical protein